MIQLHAITKIYNENKPNSCKALDGIDLQIQDGSFVAIMGKSGSGKSTLLHIMAGIDFPTSGTVEIAGKPLHTMREKELARFRNAQIGIVLQQFYLIEECKVLDNVRMPLEFSADKKQNKTEAAIKMICQMGLENQVRKKVRDLSGGEKQRVAIARALIMEPQILFADEPTGSLDSENSRNIMELLQRINQKLHITIVIITHDNEVASYCDRVLRLHDGKIISDQQRDPVV